MPPKTACLGHDDALAGERLSVGFVDSLAAGPPRFQSQKRLSGSYPRCSQRGILALSQDRSKAVHAASSTEGLGLAMHSQRSRSSAPSSYRRFSVSYKQACKPDHPPLKSTNLASVAATLNHGAKPHTYLPQHLASVWDIR